MKSERFGISVKFNGENTAKDFVAICSSFQSPIDVKAGRYMVDGKSLLGVLAICDMQDITVWLISSNPYEQQDFADAMERFHA